MTRSRAAASQSSAGRRWALRDVLLAAQIALCCVTVTAAFVSLARPGQSADHGPGFQSEACCADEIRSEPGWLFQRAAADHFQRQLLERVSQLPGVEAAGYANTTPLSLDTADSASSLNKLSISGPRTQHLMPSTTTSRLDISPPLQPHCWRDAM